MRAPWFLRALLRLRGGLRDGRGRLLGPLAAFPALALLAASGCYTEIGNPAKESQVTATFSIDYSAGPALPKAAARASAGLLSIEQLTFNLVEANYSTPEKEDNRLWKVADTLGKPVDFTGRDTNAVLPAVTVPAAEFIFVKLENRIPDHDTLRADTLDFAAFANTGYIKGAYAEGARTRRFLCQLPAVYRVNLVFEQALLESFRHGDAYALDVVFFARRWLGAVDLFAADTVLDKSGQAVAILDLENNRPLYDSLSKNFYKSFNSSKVWKEIRE